MSAATPHEAKRRPGQRLASQRTLLCLLEAHRTPCVVDRDLTHGFHSIRAAEGRSRGRYGEFDQGRLRKPPTRTAGTKTAWVTMRVQRGSPSGALRSDIVANAVRNAAKPAEWSTGCWVATLAVTNPPSKPTPAMPTRKAIKRMSQPAPGEKTASEKVLIRITNGTTREAYPANTATTPRDSVRHPASQATSSSVSTPPMRTRPAISSTFRSNACDSDGQRDNPSINPPLSIEWPNALSLTCVPPVEQQPPLPARCGDDSDGQHEEEPRPPNGPRGLTEPVLNEIGQAAEHPRERQGGHEGDEGDEVGERIHGGDSCASAHVGMRLPGRATPSPLK